jgi:hypothetical protein
MFGAAVNNATLIRSATFHKRGTVARPYFSICIPQYNRTSFLLKACRSLAEKFRYFEVRISERLTDGCEQEFDDLRTIETQPTHPLETYRRSSNALGQ